MKMSACAAFSASVCDQAAASFHASCARSYACGAESPVFYTDTISMVSVFLCVLCLAGLILYCSAIILHITMILPILPGLLILACLICLLRSQLPPRSKD